MSKAILRASFVIGTLTCIGKFIGFLKQSLIASTFGTTTLTDIYFAVDSYWLILANVNIMAVSPCIITKYVEIIQERNSKNSNIFLSSCYILFGLFAVLGILLNLFFKDSIRSVIIAGFDENYYQVFECCFVILSPILLISAITGVSLAILEAHNIFYPGKLLSVFFSLSIITSVVLASDNLGIYSLIIGFLCGYMLHCIYISTLAFRKFSFCTSNPLNNKDICRLCSLIIPIAIGNCLVDFGHLVDKIIAIMVAEGGVSLLYYGQVISNDIVSSVIVTSVGTVFFPTIVRLVKSDSGKSAILDEINNILNILFFFTSIITVIYFLEGRNLISLFYEHGKFSKTNTIEVYYILECYSFGFVFLGFRDIFTRVFYAYDNTRMPMINGVIGIIINLLLSIALSSFLGINGIALATSLSIAIVSIMLGVSLNNFLGYCPIKKTTAINMFKTIIVTILCGFVSNYTISLILTQYIIFNIVIGIFVILLYYIIIGILIKEAITINVIKKFKELKIPINIETSNTDEHLK